MNPIIIHTEGGGRLADDCSPDYVKSVAAMIAAADRTVIHLHGGLVNEQGGRAIADRLDPYYSQAGLLPVFFVWETGLFETIGNNLRRIAGEDIYQKLLAKLLRHLAGKLFLDMPGAKAATETCPLPSPVEIQEQLAGVSVDQEPYAGRPPVSTTEFTSAEEARFATELETDPAFQQAVANVLAGLAIEPPPGSKSPAQPVKPALTLMSQSVTAELKAGATKPGSKGLMEVAGLIKHATKILFRVIKRFAQKRDHGLYTTIVEELLRELYVDAIGWRVWGSMKDDARDNFAAPAGDQISGGHLLMSELQKAVQARVAQGLPAPKVSIIGHSAGTIFACELLKHVAQHCPAVSLHRLVFLAAACRCDLFADVLQRHAQRPLWQAFRSFALSDELERGYWEVPLVYPRSLLYLVSGLVETENGGSAFDMPLAGMQRYMSQTTVYTQQEVIAVRQQMLGPPSLSAWSIQDSGPGWRINAVKHGAVDDNTGDRTWAMQSVLEFLV